MKLITIDMDALAKAIDSNTDANEQEARSIINTGAEMIRGKTDKERWLDGDELLSAPQEASKPEALELSEDEAAMLRILRQSNVLTGPEKAILTKVLDASKEASKVEPVAEGEPVSEEIAVMLGERVAFLRDPAVYRGKHWPTMTNEQRKRAFAKLDGGAAGFKNHLWAWKHFDMAAEDIGVPASPKALSDADGEAFRKAAELGLTLRFYGGCAQSGMPGSPSVYEVVLGSDRAASMREAVNRAAQAAIGGKA